MSLKIRAENYFQASNWSTPVLLNIGSSPQKQGVPEGAAIYGLSVIAALIAVELVILIALNLVIHWKRRKGKVVSLKVRSSQ